MSEAEKIIAAVVAGLVVLLPVVATFVLAILNRRDVARGRVAQADAVQAVHVLVNDKFTVALKEIAGDKTRIAELTGKATDAAVAERAVAQVESHAVEAGVSAATAAAVAAASKKKA